MIDRLQSSTERCTGLSKLKTQLDNFSAAVDKIKNLNTGTAKITELVNTLNKLNNIKTPNLTKLSSQIEKFSEISTVFNSINLGANNLESFVNGINSLNNISVPSLTRLGNQITKLCTIADELNSMPDITDNVGNFVNAIKPFETLGKNNINSFLKSLEKLPEISQKLNSIDLEGFADSLSRITSAITPLANAMEKLGNGYSALPSNIKQVISSNQQLVTSTQKVEKVQVSLGDVIGKIKLKIFALVYAYDKISDVLGECLDSSNEYVENLNLFTVAMGDGAQAALDYAEKVNSLLGIDVSEWIRNQGTFKQITTGFGVVQEKADLMSKNLTQLGYDISSFFNIDTEESMTKLQSGISGELEPLRRLGYALDAATLQQIAYDHGIQQNINTMTQAQKSQLRYLAIMEQSENVMGDMARTIITPANSMRILSQQFEQLKRAIGNVVSVFAVKLIPYIQVAIRLLTDLANWAANKLGFELPEIDYDGSGLSSITDEMSDLAENADTASDSVSDMVKEVQRLAGFDELNILQKNTTDTDSGSGGTTDDALDLTDWSVDLPEYDFLAGLDKQTDDLYNDIKSKIENFISKLKSLKTWIQKNKELIEKVAKLLATIWALTKLKNFINKVLDLVNAFKKLTIIQNLSGWLKLFIDGFKNSEASTFFGKISDGVAKARSQMSKLTQAIGTIVGQVMAGYGSYNLFYDLTNDTLTWKSALGDAALIVGGLAVSWIFGGLPGLGVTLVTTEFAALYGAAKSAKEEADAALQKCLDSEWQSAGTSIKEVASSISEYCSSLTETETAFNTSYQAIDDLKIAAQEASDNIGILLEDLDSEDWDTKKMQEIKTAFEELEKNSSSFADNAVTSLQNYVNANAAFIEAVGGDVEEVDRILEEAKTNANNQIDEISAKIDSLTSKENLTSDDIAQLRTLYDELAAITGVDIGPTNSSLENLNEEIKTLSSTNINLENLETTKTAMDNIAQSLTESQQQLKEAKGNIEATINTLAISEEDKQYLKDTFTDVFELKEQDLQKIADNLSPIKDKMNEVVEQGLADIENGYLEGFGTFFIDEMFDTNRSNQEIKQMQEEWLASIGMGGGADNFIKNAMLENGMTLSDYETLFNYKAAEEATLTYSERLDNLCQNYWGVTYGDILRYQISNGSKDLAKSYIRGFTGEIEYDSKIVMEVVSEIFSDTASERIKEEQFQNGSDLNDAIISGYMKQAMANSPELQEIIDDSIILPFDSVDLTNTGENIGESFSSGLSCGLEGVVNTCNSTLKNFESFETQIMNAYNDAVPTLQTMMGGISAVAGTAMGQIDFVSYTTKGRQIAGYASGGYPTSADLFYANEDGRPEMVGRIGSKTAVANTDQIIAGIASGVKQAILETGGIVQSSGSSAQQGDTYIFIDGDEMSYRMERRETAQAKRTGGRYK